MCQNYGGIITFVIMQMQTSFNKVLIYSCVLVLSACHLARKVPDGKHLLVENTVVSDDPQVNVSEIFEVLKQERNTGVLKKVKLRLRIFNSVSDKKIEKGINKRLKRYKKINHKKLAKELKINKKRRNKAIKEGRDSFVPKIKQLKDTINIKSTFRQKLKYKVGQAPVIIDSALTAASIKQIEKYMRTKGYFNSHVSAKLDTIFRKNGKLDAKKAWVNYEIKAGNRKIIDSVILEVQTDRFSSSFRRFLKKNPNNVFYQGLKKGIFDGEVVNIPYDADQLDEIRYSMATYLRNETMYGFSESFISYFADTNRLDNKVTLHMKVSKRPILDDAGKVLGYIEHPLTRIYRVNFHLLDSSRVDTNFLGYVKKSDPYASSVLSDGVLRTMDTIYFQKMKHKIQDYSITDEKIIFKSKVNKNIFGQYKDSIGLNQNRFAYVYYNQELSVDPVLIEAQNYLENGNSYKAKYFDRSSIRLNSLGLFSTVKIKITEIEPGKLHVDYYLTPLKKQTISFQPKATNSSGFLGLSAQASYVNRNLRKKGINFSVAAQFGLEANSLVFEDVQLGSETQTRGYKLNTIDANIPVKFDIPGMFPFGLKYFRGKRQRPRTNLSFGAGYQLRPEFSRTLAQFNYLFKFFPGTGKTQTVTVGMLGLSVFKFVSISNETPIFLQNLNNGGDLFLRNTYADQFIWENFKMQFDYDNSGDEERGKTLRTFSASFSSAGLAASWVTSIKPTYDSDGRKLLFGVPYSQFRSIDTKYVSNTEYKKHKFLSYKVQLGVGLPYGNTKTSLPYDYSFFGGGSNDNRGWGARTLGPGNYAPLLDTNANLTQIGDIRLASSFEWRIGNGGYFNHAFFVDCGNIWTKNLDPNRPGSQFQFSEFWKDLAVSAGYGLRFDLSFFVLRFDFAFPLHDPSYSKSEQWIFQKKDQFELDLQTVYGGDWYKYRPKYYRPHFQFGIGYPF